MLTIPPERMAYEAARAAEIQRADAALRRERLLWYFAAVACLLVGALVASVGFHVRSLTSGAVWIATGALIGEIGPMVILLIAVHREQG